MLFPKRRMQYFNKLAQQASTTPQAVPTTTVAPPPNFEASSAWGWLNGSYNSYSLTTLNNLISTLNTALHISSNGQFNFQILHGNSFQVDISASPSADVKNLLTISILIYKTFLNNGNPFEVKPTSKQIQIWGQQIINSPSFMNLSQINPTGALAQKISGNLKNNILNFIRYLDSYNPVS